jgi:hypothetical protein
MREIQVYGASLLALGISTSVGAIQTLLTPDETWIPLGVLVGMLGLAIAVTVKVMRLLARFDALSEDVVEVVQRQRRIMTELHMRFKENPGE